MPLLVWKQVRGFRNVIVRSYGSIDRIWAWDTIQSDIPDLKHRILALDEVRCAYEAEPSEIANEVAGREALGE